MASKPSTRTHRMRPDDTLNLTPLIDMITCLMFFLMMFASILPVVIIDAPLPKVASTAEEVKKAKDDDNKMELMVYISSKGFDVKGDFGSSSFLKRTDGKFPYDELHKFLVQLHSKRPKHKEITLMPSDDVTYEMMVKVMDAARELSKDDPGFKPVPPEIAQKPERIQVNGLFPDVTIGGI